MRLGTLHHGRRGAYGLAGFRLADLVLLHGGNGTPAPAPPISVIRWVSAGDCPDDPHLMVGTATNRCVDGSTLIWTGPTAPVVSSMIVMDQTIANGVFQHELLHAWLALSRTQDDGDKKHERPEWGWLLSDAARDVPVDNL
jgi:hypothetical protein